MPFKLTAFAFLFVTATAFAANEQTAPYKSSQEIIDASPASAWRTPDPANLLYMELDKGRVIIELAPEFAPMHVANIKALAQGKFWDGLSIYRSQDNFVVQFGDPDADKPEKNKAFPKQTKSKLPAEYERTSKGLHFVSLPDKDGWANETGFVNGFATARDSANGVSWLAHCYGVLGAGRDTAPDSSTGAELYVVTGQSPRTLDRNITVVGRVLKGMELLSVLPRGTGPLGFYTSEAERTPIRSIRVASDVPRNQRTNIEVMRTDSETFAQVVEARRNRRDGWYVRPAGHIDLCNITVPMRELNP